MNNKGNLAAMIVKPIMSVIGFAAILLGFIKMPSIESIFSINLSTYSVFSLFGGLLGEFLDSDELSQVKTFIIIIVAVLFVLALLQVITSFLNNKAKSIAPIVCGGLNIILSLAFIIFIKNAASLSGDDIFSDLLSGVELIKAGEGWYVLMLTSLVVIVMAVLELVIFDKNSEIPNNQYVIDGGSFDQNCFASEKLTLGANPDDIPGYGPTSSNTTFYSNGTITALGGEYAGCSFPIEDSEILIIGKDPSKCHIVITENSKYISRIHCSVKFENGTYYVCDYSTNGVLVDSQPIQKEAWVSFMPGSVISLSNNGVSFKLG